MVFRIEIDRHTTGIGKLYGITEKVEDNLTYPGRIAQYVLLGIRSDVQPDVQSLFCGPSAHNGNRIVKKARQVKGGFLDGHLTGFEFREIENVVDDRQQGVARGPDDFRLISGFRRQARRIHQQFSKPHNGVHGGSNFMAHIGDECRLRLACGLRPLFG